MDKNTFCSIMLASKSSYKFLGAPDGFWLGVTDDGVEKMYSFDEMPEEYKKNCIKYLEDQRKNIEKSAYPPLFPPYPKGTFISPPSS